MTNTTKTEEGKPIKIFVITSLALYKAPGTFSHSTHFGVFDSVDESLGRAVKFVNEKKPGFSVEDFLQETFSLERMKEIVARMEGKSTTEATDASPSPALSHSSESASSSAAGVGREKA